MVQIYYMAAEKTTPVQARITELQSTWLRARADREHGGNLSEALRATMTEARILRMMMAEYRDLHDRHGFQLGRGPNGATTLMETVLSGFLAVGQGVWESGDEAFD